MDAFLQKAEDLYEDIPLRQYVCCPCICIVDLFRDCMVMFRHRSHPYESFSDEKPSLLQQNVKMAADQDYPAYGVTGPGAKSQMTAGDKKLAQSAQMYHYQHQKQQMLAMEKNHGDMKRNDSDDETEEETEEGDYTVYECPGLAPTGEMEVKNPLFDHDSQPPPGSAK
ncbi:NPDC1 [Branchiostoma lanceolatum]|uniref:NPDC1 protein n=1 Tax=Branchiostoma lanceolatum TaxID=7740 RepID=A0A8K0A9Y4_BRALA|nr:NPDC1 [Branchiostoma lanceolatum]